MDDPKQFKTLVSIMDRLRAPDGCPWDREQDYRSLRGYLIEECYEVAEAIDRGAFDELEEELGDLLLQIVFLARIAKEEGRFTDEDVVAGIVGKMIRRHPHVFGDDTADSSEEVLERWEEIKAEEKRRASAGRPDPAGGDGPPSVIDGVPRALPALLKAHRLGTKAARVGFDWDDAGQVLDKVEEEIAELRRAVANGRADAVEEEVGDVLFSAAMLARKLSIDPEAALERTNLKFSRRFRWMERQLAAAGEEVGKSDFERLERLWQRSKDEA